MRRALTDRGEAALLRAVAREWEGQNHGRFRGALRRPVFRLVDSTARLGTWDRARREIALSRVLFTRGWGAVLEVLKHEMAHQYAHEVLGAVDESAHGRAFREVCARFGIDPRASGEPRPAEVEDRVLRRVTRLLALAESPNVHEAQAAMRAAQDLLLRYNLDAPAARHDVAWRHLGSPLARLYEPDRILAALLTTHFFVECIWVSVYLPEADRYARQLEACGTPENLEFASYVHDFLRGTGDRLYAAQGRGLRGGRGAFLAGLFRGFHEKLDEQAKGQREAGLVWVGDPAVRAYLRDRHPHVRTLRGTGVRRTDAWEEGRAAGRELVLHKPVRERGTGGGLLPGEGAAKRGG